MGITLPVIVFVSTLLVDGLTWVLQKRNTKAAQVFAGLNVLLISFTISSLLFVNFNFCAGLFVLVSIFRMINSGRIVAQRQHKMSLYRKFGLSAVWLGVLSTITFVNSHYDRGVDIAFVLSAGALVIAAVYLITTLKSLYQWKPDKNSLVDLKTLPTVSICIPARNETQDLPECIESLIASSYPKLEILVLDDCSYDKTPEIIRKYAHAGVRFIKGAEPKDGWLAKNQALNKLFDESLGEIVIFAGVDVRLQSDSVHKIVNNLQNYDMVSVLPQRSENHEGSYFLQPLRYWWELSVPRLKNKRPPVLSTLWAIRRKALVGIGEFDSVRRSVQPERHFANRLSRKFRFITKGSEVGVESVKGIREQFDTAVRVRYPQVGRKPELVLMLAAVHSIVFVGTILSFVNGYVTIGITTVLMLVISNLLVSRLYLNKLWVLSAFSIPFLMIEDVYFAFRSMLAYEFGVVKWKERNICLPMLQVEKSLPKLKE